MATRILVIGDSCQDQFTYCSATRLCPDVPVPVLVRQSQTSNPGMAMNVRENIVGLREPCDIWTNDNWSTVTKTRFVDIVSNHTFIRLDAGEDTIMRIKLPSSNYKDILNSYEVVAISDYNKGFLTYEDIIAISSAHPCVFLDTKKRLIPEFSACAYIKINTPEYRASQEIVTTHPELASKLIVTAGADGCYYQGENFPTERVAVRDVSGAGDTFFAGLIVAYLRQRDIRSAITVANKMAARVVQQRGVNTISAD